MGYINQFGDYVNDYIVEMGRTNDTWARIVRVVTAKCDYMAAEIAEKSTPGYVAFNVYRKEMERRVIV